MPTLLDFAYMAAAGLAWPWLLLRRLRRGRWVAGLGQRVAGTAPTPPAGDGPVVWLHGVSVGEINLLKPLIDGLRARRPDLRCVLSTTTHAGYELARDQHPDLPVFYCPLDFSWSVRRAFSQIDPDLLVLAELELWPQWIAEASRRNTPVAVINARLSSRSARGYRWLGGLARRMLQRIAWIGAHDADSAERFLRLGAHPADVTRTGSLKFDGACLDRQDARVQALRRQVGVLCDGPVLVAGSTQPEDEQAVLTAYCSLRHRFPHLRLIVVPRSPQRFEEAARRVRSFGLPVIKRTDLDDVLSEEPTPSTVLIVNTIGELSAWWGLADIAFVGGALGRRGGQNMIEPAGYGAPVCFGPNTKNFRSVVEMLLRSDAARVVNNAADLETFVADCLEHPDRAAAMGSRAQALVLRQQGALAKTIEHLLILAPQQTRTRAAA